MRRAVRGVGFMDDVQLHVVMLAVVCMLGRRVEVKLLREEQVALGPVLVLRKLGLEERVRAHFLIEIDLEMAVGRPL